VQLGKMLSPKARLGGAPDPYLRNCNVQWGRLDLSDLSRMDFSSEDRVKFALRSGDLLVCEGGEPGRCAVLETDLPGVFFQKALMRVRPNAERLDTRFLQRFMHYAGGRGVFVKDGNQATIAHFPAVRLNALEIPLPPLSEQRRIAAILDKADAVRHKRQEAIALIEQLLRSTFQEMFGAVSDRVALSEICKRVTDGTHQPPEWTPCGVPFIFISNIGSRGISFETKKFVSEDTWMELTCRCPIETHDILYTTVGSYGNAAIVEDGMPRFAFQRHIAHIKPDLALVNPCYLLAAMCTPEVRRQADVHARGVAQKTLNLAQLKNFQIPFPQRELQDRYARFHQLVACSIEKQVKALSLAEMAFHSLVQRAFSGQL
jgi:type I restriction enzyme S subunit